MLIMHATNILESVCQLTGFDKIFCGCICCIAFFVYEVAVLIYLQTIYLSSSDCKAETPKQYYWLLVNLIVYFLFFFLAIFIQIKSWIAKPSEEDAEKEVTEDEKANPVHWTPDSLSLNNHLWEEVYTTFSYLSFK